MTYKQFEIAKEFNDREVAVLETLTNMQVYELKQLANSHHIEEIASVRLLEALEIDTQIISVVRVLVRAVPYLKH